ncbi:MAG: glycosyltransferase [Pseudomonadota bacterium]
MSANPAISIIMPAFNEAAVIGRTLEHLIDDGVSNALKSGAWQLIIVANGCRDNTVEIIRQGWPDVTILELAQASKTAALRAGAALATGPAWVVMDADIDVRPSDIKALVAGLDAEAAVAAIGQFQPNTATAGYLVRLFYAAWRHHPYFDGGKFGGCYALKASDTGHLLETIPDLTNDDEWIAREVAKLGKTSETKAQIRTNAPRGLGDLIRVRRRIYRGNAELAGLAKQGIKQGANRRLGTRHLIKRLAVRPQLWPAGLCYFGVNSVAKITNVFNLQSTDWEQAKRY